MHALPESLEKVLLSFSSLWGRGHLYFGLTNGEAGVQRVYSGLPGRRVSHVKICQEHPSGFLPKILLPRVCFNFQGKIKSRGKRVMGKTQGSRVTGLCLNQRSVTFWQIQEITYMAQAPASFSKKERFCEVK